MEKPLALTPAECLAIQRLAWARKLPVAVGFNRRFAPATEYLRQAFQAARSPVSVFYRISDDDRVRPPEQQWKKEDRLLLEVVHIFDLLTYLLAAEPVKIYACESRFNDALVTVEYAGGSRATIHSSSYGSLAQPKEHLEAVLDRGAVEMDDFVEIRSYGLPALAPVLRFAGRAYDGCDNRHVEDFARRGLAALVGFPRPLRASHGRRRRAGRAARRRRLGPRRGVLGRSSPAAGQLCAGQGLGDRSGKFLPRGGRRPDAPQRHGHRRQPGHVLCDIGPPLDRNGRARAARPETLAGTDTLANRPSGSAR